MKNRNILFVVLGLLLPTLFFLIMDWYDVKVKSIEISDLIGWIIWFLLGAPLIFIGIKNITNRILNSIFYTILILISLAIIDIILLMNFHFLIGGSK